MVSYDYNGLGECSPDVSQAKILGDGSAVLSFAIPEGCSVQHWNIKTFHVPDPANWMDHQIKTDDKSGDYGPGEYNLILATIQGACQLDMYQGEDGSPIYAGDTSLDCYPQARQVAPVPTPQPPASETPSVAPPAALPDVVASTTGEPAQQASTVALVTHQPTLPATGPALPPELGGSVALALLVLGCASIRLAKRFGLRNC